MRRPGVHEGAAGPAAATGLREAQERLKQGGWLDRVSGKAKQDQEAQAEGRERLAQSTERVNHWMEHAHFGDGSPKNIFFQLSFERFNLWKLWHKRIIPSARLAYKPTLRTARNFA